MLAGSAIGRTPPLQSALDGRLHWGSCTLQLDGAEEIPESVWPAVCVKPKVSVQGAFRDDTGTKNLAMLQSRIYYGVHIHRLFSIHGEHVAQRIFALGAEENRATNGAKTEDLFFQVGNVAQDKWRFAGGMLDMPFGLDFRPLIDIYDEMIKTRKFWRFPRYGANLTFDSQVSSQYEVGYATDMINDETAFERQGEKSTNEALAVRTMFDVAALDGFRFVFSGYGDRQGERRMGVGLVNIARRGDESVFEYVHLRPQPSRDGQFDQLFRFGFRSAYRGGMRWIFEYESDRLDYRMGTVGCDLTLPDYGTFSFATSYHKGWFKDQDDFLVVASSFQLAL